MENKKKIINHYISKGGLFGALAGSFVSTQFHTKSDTPLKKASKTGLFALLGYLIGTFLEKIFKLKL